MRRSLPAVLVLVLVFASAPDAAGKVPLKKAKACDASRCETQSARADGPLPFELLGPTMEIGRRTPEPAHPGRRMFRVRLTTKPVRGPDTIRLRYFPATGYINIPGERWVTTGGGATLNVGWVPLEPAERSAYDALIAPPAPPAAASRGSWSWAAVLPW